MDVQVQEQERAYANVDPLSDALAHLQNAQRRFADSEHRLGVFRLKYFRCTVFDRDALVAEKFEAEKECAAAGREFQDALITYARIKQDQEATQHVR